MIDLYTWTTPNGRKVSILLEELGVPYNIYPIDITKDEQFSPSFLKIAPKQKQERLQNLNANQLATQGAFPPTLF